MIISDTVIFRDFIKTAFEKLSFASNTFLEQPPRRVFSQVSTSAHFIGNAARAEWDQALNGCVGHGATRDTGISPLLLTSLSAAPLTLGASILDNNDMITWSIVSGNAEGKFSVATSLLCIQLLLRYPYLHML